MAYLSTQNQRPGKRLVARFIADADHLLGHAAVAASLLFIITLLVVL